VLHLLHETQQVRFTFPCRLALVPSFSLSFKGGVLVGLGGGELLTQQVPLLLHGQNRLNFCGCSGVLRHSGAWCCILERCRVRLERVRLERVACTQQFRGVEMAIGIRTEAAGMDGAVQGGACNTCHTRCATDGELGHG
jgi:hypothetical protein